ncbi:MAG: response regulator transcription factor [Anaerolineales bacterium]|nr:response regulator transcription factor [Anaerolineales bacterium]
MLQEKISCGSLSINPVLRQVHNQAQLICLSKLEFDLLLYLMRHANQICSYEQLLKEVWLHQPCHTPDATIVRLALCRLRKKLSHHSQNPFALMTVREVGVYFKTSEPIETN